MNANDFSAYIFYTYVYICVSACIYQYTYSFLFSHLPSPLQDILVLYFSSKQEGLIVCLWVSMSIVKIIRSRKHSQILFWFLSQGSIQVSVSGAGEP